MHQIAAQRDQRSQSSRVAVVAWGTELVALQLSDRAITPVEVAIAALQVQPCVLACRFRKSWPCARAQIQYHHVHQEDHNLVTVPEHSLSRNTSVSRSSSTI